MFCWFYLRLRRIRAAAAAITMIITAPMVTYVAVGCALVGGMIAGLGVGANVADAGVVGAIVLVGAVVGADVGVATGAGEAAALTPMLVSSEEP